jgi:hypothetical protein
MARFDPNTYPDRLAFEANARRIRGEELKKVFAPARAWLEARQQGLGHRMGRFAAALSAHSHRPTTH